MTDAGDTKEDLKLPENNDDLVKEITTEFEADKEVYITV